MVAFKIPTGKLSELSGSGTPDVGFNFLAEFHPWWMFSFYIHNGLVIPFDTMIPGGAEPGVMYNGLLGMEFHPNKYFSLLVQWHIRNSPISLQNDRNHYSLNYPQYSLPQTNILVGFIIQYLNFKWQLYIEEDLLTNQGTDIVFNFRFSYKFMVHRPGQLYWK